MKQDSRERRQELTRVVNIENTHDTRMIPRPHFVLVEEKDQLRETASGLILPDSNRKEFGKIGVVVGIGENVNDVKLGDKILFNYYDAVQFKHQGVQHYLVKDDLIFAVLEDSDDTQVIAHQATTAYREKVV